MFESYKSRGLGKTAHRNVIHERIEWKLGLISILKESKQKV
jgi:hypothetical protein